MTVALQLAGSRWPYVGMTDAPTDDLLDPARLEQRRIGQALKRMREDRGLTQAKAAERFNVSTQAWQRYESGERQWTQYKMARVAEALGGDLEELLRYRSMLDAPPGTVGEVIGLNDRGRAFAQPAARPTGLVNELAALLGAHADRMRLATDALSPWAEGGELIVFDRERPPRKGHGCVVEDLDGKLSVWMFDGRDGQTVRLYTLAPERADTALPADQLRGVYAVRLRGD